MPIYVFGCTQGHRSEAIRPAGTTHNACPHCGEMSPRVYGYSMALTQPEVDTRGMFRRFDEASQELEHQGIAAPTWRQAKARAEAITRAGENEARRQW